MAHVNNSKPNILQDKIAGARRDLRDRDMSGNLSAKRWLAPRKVYPYSNTHQNTRRTGK